jgi:metal-responsive CopG/Arc/MetJ family transcriptional regulator
MAKVRISIPDQLLAKVDALARARGVSRSGLLQDLATRAVERDPQSLKQRVEEFLATSEPHGGNAVELIRAARNGARPTRAD